ncbi:SDR family NAD(P)-dependent oxidoreductase [Sorangium sp. So ce887]
MTTMEDELRKRLQQAIVELNQRRQSLALATEKAHEPIAIVAMSCRFPGGVATPEDLWRLLEGGHDAISPFPDDRGWDLGALDAREKAGNACTREGGFLRDADRFDASFFGISPRETLALDPQQRVFLEIAWEAIERAGIDPTTLHGTQTGVFAGVMYNSYAAQHLHAPDDRDGYVVTGTAPSVASGRIAYALGLEGPAISIDTACSSSLVAVHLACHALRQGECALALAGGVTVMATPGLFYEFGPQHAGAPDGRCKSFSADANGAGWAEGAGMVLLERLSDAQKNGHPVLAVVRGSMINQDGKSQGLTAPNGLAQERVIRSALAGARVSANEVDAVEAHGTGTSLGDPIEAQALLATYGKARSEGDPVWLGSLKSNIGHTQAAAGVAGIIKMVLALEHGLLPKTLHVSAPSPHVDWSAGTVRLLTDAVPWPRGVRPRRAAVSSFGISGTNAHVIVEEAPAPAASAAAAVEPVPRAPGALPIVLSAKSDAALRAQAAKLHAHLAAAPDVPLVDLAFSLATTRAQLDHRAALVAHDRATLLGALDALEHGRSTSGAALGRGALGGKLAVLFTGQGSQRAEMGRGLHAAFPAFRGAFDAVCDHLDRALDRPLRDVLFAPRGTELARLLDETLYTQTALFAVEVALFRLLEAWGITPHALLGHSVGELVAAHVAGVLSLEDACALVAARARLMQDLPARDAAMVTVHASEGEARAAIAAVSGDVAIAAINAPTSVVLSGDADAVLAVAARFEALGRKTTRLRVSHAFHSHHMDPMLDAFRRVAEGLRFHPPRIPIVSNVTGERARDEDICSPSYWVRHARDGVRFADGLETLRSMGVSTFLEVGPHGVLSALGQSARTADAGDEHAFIPALRADRSDVDAIASALAALFVRGQRVDWAAFFAPLRPRRVRLPTYAFQRERFWLDAARASAAAPVTSEETRFWQAVEQRDVEELAAALRVGGEGRASLAALLPALAAWRRERHEQGTVDAWRYRVVWKPIEAPPAGDVAGRWLVVARAGVAEDVAASLARLLEARGAEVVHLRLGGDDVRRERAAARIGEAIGDAGAVRGVLSLAALDEGTRWPDAALPAGLAFTLGLVQALGDVGVAAPLWLVTRGAVSTGRADPLGRATDAMIWGLGRIVGLEHPERWGGLVDIASGVDATALDRLAPLLAARGGEDQLALRPTGVFARRLVRAPLGDAPPARTFTPRGTALVTGGTGALGAHVARFLVGRGAEHLVLVSRRGEDAPGAGALRAELEALGARVTIAACDVADRASVAALLARLDAQGDHVRVVVHAGGVVAQAALASTDLDDVHAVVAAKVRGALHLHELLGDRELDAFVLFASGAGVWGSGQQGAYAAGNAFLDALAEVRRAAGLTATSIAWGAWAGAGMLAEHADAEEHLRRRGLAPMAPALALVALARALDHDETTITVADIDWARFAPAFASARPRPLLFDLPDACDALEPPSEPAGARAAGEDRTLRDALRPLSDTERARHLVELVIAETAAVLGHADASAVEPHRGFFDLGLDSIVAVDLLRKLHARTGVKLPATLAFDHPTPDALARHLDAEIARDGGTEDAVFAALNTLASRLAAITPGDPRRAAVGARLRGLVSRWTSAEAATEEAVSEDLGAISDDELLAVIERELDGEPRAASI